MATLPAMPTPVQSLVATMTWAILAGGCGDATKSSPPSDPTGESTGPTTTAGQTAGTETNGGPSSALSTTVTPIASSAASTGDAPLTPGPSRTETSATTSAGASATTSGDDGDPGASEAGSNASDDNTGTVTAPESTRDESMSTTSDDGSGAVNPSPGCGKSPTLKNSPAGTNFQQNSITAGGSNREFIVRWPTEYDNTRPYRLILGLHGATGKGSDIAGDYFGLWDLAEGSTIFVALSAEGGLWDAQKDLIYVDEVLTRLRDELCIDTSSVLLEGFSQGAAMAWTLTCSRPGVFGAVVGHSGGGVTAPQDCEPVPYLGSLGLNEGSNSQKTQTDRFAQWNGCTVET